MGQTLYLGFLRLSKSCLPFVEEGVMKSILLMMLIAVGCSTAAARAIPRPFIPDPPGPLETFLASNPNAAVVKKQTGILLGTNQEKAVFIAIVASAPSAPSAKIKGMEIQITDDGHPYTLYLDYEPAAPPHSKDNFQDFLQLLADLADKNAAIKRFYEQAPYGTEASRWGMTTGADFHGSDILNIGWLHTEDGMAVRIDGGRRSPVPGCFYFPGATVAQVITSINAAREFLATN